MNPAWLLAVLLAASGAQAQNATTTLEAPGTAPAGSTILVEWTGPDAKGDYIAASKAGSPDDASINQSRTSIGSPLQLELPDRPGAYELRYVSKATGAVLARHPIEAAPVEATVVAPEEAPAGSVLLVEWTGPDYARDHIAIGDFAKPDEAIHYTATRTGSPLQLQVPGQPGTYEVRYVLGQSGRVLGGRLIEVTPVQASIDLAATAPAGSTIKVDWEGPGYPKDYLAVSEPGTPDKDYLNYTMASKGDPAPLLLPVKPGRYEVRYFLGETNGVLARSVIEATPVEATVKAPEKGKAGRGIKVQWTGPAYPGDYISLAELGTPGNRYLHYAETSKGNPLWLKLPDEPGEYEIRYILRQGNTMLARTRIVVE